MTYHVTVRDIVHGQKDHCTEHPVARAIRRRHSTLRVKLGLTQVVIGDSRYNLPPRVWRWVDRFDAGESVRPMRFELL